MNRGVPIERLLRWRHGHAEADAPRPPSAEHLLELARGWWERWPERFRAQLARLRQMPLAYGYAMSASERDRRGHPVPTLVADAEDVETYTRVTYINVREARFRMRFQVEGAAVRPHHAFDAIFVSDASESPLCAAVAVRSHADEYRVDVDLPDHLVESWGALRVTDQMPFRMILRPTDAL
jgi:hypothetical protein